VRQAQARGVQATVYRPGFVLGSEHGFWAPANLATQFAAHDLACGIVSGSARMLLQGVPVNLIARFINACSQDPAALGETFHLSHPEPMPVASWISLLATHGISVRTVNQAEWNQSFISQTSNDMERALVELRGTGTSNTILECLQQQPAVDSQQFQRQSAVYGIAWPDFNRLVAEGWLASLRPTVRDGHIVEDRHR
jgi:thioester reductase-like protein